MKLNKKILIGVFSFLFILTFVCKAHSLVPIGEVVPVEPRVIIDGDDVDSSVDNCPFANNPDQEDMDGDGLGDACDADIDGDGFLNEDDNCPEIPNRQQADGDGDLVGDICDNCRLIDNELQEDRDEDGIGNACERDYDGDDVEDADDNCVRVANPEQEDADLNNIGDACEMTSLNNEDPLGDETPDGDDEPISHNYIDEGACNLANNGFNFPWIILGILIVMLIKSRKGAVE